jgi:predicted DNA-binding transcriptional regulator AlpA
LTDLAAALRALADRVDTLDPARVVGELEALKFAVWTRTTSPAPSPAVPVPSRGLDIDAVVERTGMSRGWLYREARAGRLPFARRLGRRISFDATGLERWLGRRRVG